MRGFISCYGSEQICCKIFLSLYVSYMIFRRLMPVKSYISFNFYLVSNPLIVSGIEVQSSFSIKDCFGVTQSIEGKPVSEGYLVSSEAELTMYSYK